MDLDSKNKHLYDSRNSDSNIPAFILNEHLQENRRRLERHQSRSTTECPFLCIIPYKKITFEYSSQLHLNISTFSQSRAVLDANNQASEGISGDLPQHIKQSRDEGRKGSQVKWHIRAGAPRKKIWISEELMLLVWSCGSWALVLVCWASSSLMVNIKWYSS